MKITALVRTGQIVTETPKLDACVHGQGDDEPDLDELDTALDESRVQIERGEYEDARTVVLRLAARM